jgi:hypothetical protein
LIELLACPRFMEDAEKDVRLGRSFRMKEFLFVRHGAPAVPVPTDNSNSLSLTDPEFSVLPERDNQETVSEKDRSRSIFAFLFPEAGEFIDKDWSSALDALGEAMVEEDDSGEADSNIPAAMTYLGQFIDHDITLNTNNDDVIQALRIDRPVIRPQNRSLVRAALRNLRSGRLDLDSVYGDSPIPDPVNGMLQRALRDPGDPRKLRVGENAVFNPPGPPPQARPERPFTAAGQAPRADLPRLGDMVGSGGPFPTLDDLPPGLRPDPSDTFGVWKRKAFIGDGRNDENLVLAQMHVAFLRFHNAVVDALGPTGTFDEARRQTVWHYQWLIVNAYLPSICDPGVVEEVIATGAPLYDHFLAAQQNSGGVVPGHLPLPFEFSTAAFRFGHSMVRGQYDYNLNFGPDGPVPATLDLLFAFTGNKPVERDSEGNITTGPIGRNATERLEENWIIDWSRFTSVGPGIRRARKIDSRIARVLTELPNEAAGVVTGLLKDLARRNLRRGMVQNLPPAQAILDRLGSKGIMLPRLTPAQLAVTGRSVVADHGFDVQTPLWFYVLKEAEHLGGGDHLGPLGSRIVAETLVGLLDHDPTSYWFAPTPGGRRWSPSDGVRPGGVVPNSLTQFFAAAGV